MANILLTLKKHSTVFLFGVLFNRIVPAFLIRFRRFAIFKLVDAEQKPDDVSPNQKISVFIVDSPTKLARLADITGVDPKEVSADSVCIAAEIENELVGGLYLKPGNFLERELGLNVELPADSYWLFAAGVSKPMRRHGVYRSLLEFLRTDSRIKDADIFFSVDAFNRPSIRAHAKFTDATLGLFFTLKILSLAATTARTARNESHHCRVVNQFSWRARRNPLLISIDSNRPLPD